MQIGCRKTGSMALRHSGVKSRKWKFPVIGIVCPYDSGNTKRKTGKEKQLKKGGSTRAQKENRIRKEQKADSQKLDHIIYIKED